MCDHRDRDGERGRGRGEREKWDRQQALNSLCSLAPSIPLLSLRGGWEGDRRRSPTPTSTQSTCRRPCSSWIQCPLPPFVIAAISPQLAPGYTAAGAAMPLQPDAFFFCFCFLHLANISLAESSVSCQRIALRQVI